jgi:hypothetical protein
MESERSTSSENTKRSRSRLDTFFAVFFAIISGQVTLAILHDHEAARLSALLCGLVTALVVFLVVRYSVPYFPQTLLDKSRKWERPVLYLVALLVLINTVSLLPNSAHDPSALGHSLVGFSVSLGCFAIAAKSRLIAIVTLVPCLAAILAVVSLPLAVLLYSAILSGLMGIFSIGIVFTEALSDQFRW